MVDMDTLIYSNKFDLNSFNRITSFTNVGVDYTHYNTIKRLTRFMGSEFKVISHYELPNMVYVKIYCSDDKALSVAFEKPGYSDELTDYITQGLESYLRDHSETELPAKSADEILYIIRNR